MYLTVRSRIIAFGGICLTAVIGLFGVRITVSQRAPGGMSSRLKNTRYPAARNGSTTVDRTRSRSSFT